MYFCPSCECVLDEDDVENDLCPDCNKPALNSETPWTGEDFEKYLKTLGEDYGTLIYVGDTDGASQALLHWLGVRDLWEEHDLDEHYDFYNDVLEGLDLWTLTQDWGGYAPGMSGELIAIFSEFRDKKLRAEARREVRRLIREAKEKLREAEKKERQAKRAIAQCVADIEKAMRPARNHLASLKSTSPTGEIPVEALDHFWEQFHEQCLMAASTMDTDTSVKIQRAAVAKLSSFLMDRELTYPPLWKLAGFSSLDKLLNSKATPVRLGKRLERAMPLALRNWLSNLYDTSPETIASVATFEEEVFPEGLYADAEDYKSSLDGWW